jgi:alpha-beta hydrolase superfamily lysophospholipase
MTIIESTVLDANGVETFLRTWEPSGDIRGAVVVVHGASEHSGRYARLGTFLADRGFFVLAPDLRGHGRTATDTGVGIIGPGGVEGLMSGIDAVVGRAAELGSGHAPVVLGHSMGSIYALRYCETHPQNLAGLILSGAPGVLPGVEEMIDGTRGAVEAGAGEQPVLALTPFNAAFEPARTPYDWLSRDAAEVDAYIDDPLCGDEAPLTFGFVLANLETARDTLTDLSAIRKDCPVLLLAGSADPVSNSGEQVRDLGERLRAHGVAVDEHYYPDARHEILNETIRDDVHADIARWLQARFQPRAETDRAVERTRRSQ